MAKLCALCVYPFPVAITHLLFFKKPSVNINMYLHMCNTWALSNNYAINPLNPECVSVFFFFQMFHDVSVLFSDVVGFTHICSLISPMEVVTMLNNMYTVFDQISEQHNVYKVSDNLWLTASFLILHQTWECTNIFSQEFSDSIYLKE